MKNYKTHHRSYIECIKMNEIAIKIGEMIEIH